MSKFTGLFSMNVEPLITIIVIIQESFNFSRAYTCLTFYQSIPQNSDTTKTIAKVTVIALWKSFEICTGVAFLLSENRSLLALIVFCMALFASLYSD